MLARSDPQPERPLQTSKVGVFVCTGRAHANCQAMPCISIAVVGLLRDARATTSALTVNRADTTGCNVINSLKNGLRSHAASLDNFSSALEHRGPLGGERLFPCDNIGVDPVSRT